MAAITSLMADPLSMLLRTARSRKRTSNTAAVPIPGQMMPGYAPAGGRAPFTFPQHGHQRAAGSVTNRVIFMS